MECELLWRRKVLMGMNRFYSMWLLVLGLLFASRGVMAEDLTSLSDQDRQAMDPRIIAASDQRTEAPKKEFYGAIAKWSIARTPMKADDDLELGQAEHRAILKSLKTSPAPPLAEKILQQLTKHLPGVS